MTGDSDRQHPLTTLSDGDREFVLRLVLSSGSLKDLAQAYGVSYPTIRAKLDKVIAHLEGVLKNRPPEPMAELLADLTAKGEVTPSAARIVLDAHRKQLKKQKEA
jgi:hypothetical protein